MIGCVAAAPDVPPPQPTAIIAVVARQTTQIVIFPGVRLGSSRDLVPTGPRTVKGASTRPLPPPSDRGARGPRPRPTPGLALGRHHQDRGHLDHPVLFEEGAMTVMDPRNFSGAESSPAVGKRLLYDQDHRMQAGLAAPLHDLVPDIDDGTRSRCPRRPHHYRHGPTFTDPIRPGDRCSGDAIRQRRINRRHRPGAQQEDEGEQEETPSHGESITGLSSLARLRLRLRPSSGEGVRSSARCRGRMPGTPTRR